MAAYEVKGREDILLEFRLPHDQMVRGRDEDPGLRIRLGNHNGPPCHGGKRTPAYGFLQDMGIIHLGQLLIYEGEILYISRNIDVGRVNKLCHAVISLLDERPACSQQIHKLLRACCSAHRPQSASVSTGQNQAIIVFVHDSFYRFIWEKKCRPQTALIIYKVLT